MVFDFDEGLEEEPRTVGGGICLIWGERGAEEANSCNALETIVLLELRVEWSGVVEVGPVSGSDSHSIVTK